MPHRKNIIKQFNNLTSTSGYSAGKTQEPFRTNFIRLREGKMELFSTKQNPLYFSTEAAISVRLSEETSLFP